MEFTNDQLIDAALNLTGYVAAVLFSLIIYSIYFGRKISNLEDAVRCAAGWTESPGFSERSNERGAEVDPSGTHKSALRESRLNSDMGDSVGGSVDGSVADNRDTKRPEFLDLSASYQEQSYHGRADGFARNRGEVIRLARKMLEAGNTADRVSDLLPISESEMRLVQMGAQAGGLQRR